MLPSQNSHCDNEKSIMNIFSKNKEVTARSDRTIFESFIVELFVRRRGSEVICLEQLHGRWMISTYNTADFHLIDEYPIESGIQPSLMCPIGDTSNVLLYINNEIYVADYLEKSTLRGPLSLPIPAPGNSSLMNKLSRKFGTKDVEMTGVNDLIATEKEHIVVVHGNCGNAWRGCFFALDLDRLEVAGEVVRIDDPIPELNRPVDNFSEQMCRGVFDQVNERYITADRRGWVMFWKFGQRGFQIASGFQLDAEQDGGHPDNQVEALAVAKNGEFFAVRLSSGKTYIGEAKTGRLIHRGIVPDNDTRAGGLAFSSDGTKLFSLQEGVCVVFNTKDASEDKRIEFGWTGEHLQVLNSDKILLMRYENTAGVHGLDLETGEIFESTSE
jgi:hypothetical protein